MRGGRQGFLTSLAFHIRRKKAFSWRFYCQNALFRPERFDTGFNPTKRALDRADRQFELLGAEATFQGSALKLEDAPKLRLPEVMSLLEDIHTAYYWLLGIYPHVNNGGICWDCLQGYLIGTPEDHRREGLHKIVTKGLAPAGVNF